jgi:hypothetical protein
LNPQLPAHSQQSLLLHPSPTMELPLCASTLALGLTLNRVITTTQIVKQVALGQPLDAETLPEAKADTPYHFIHTVDKDVFLLEIDMSSPKDHLVVDGKAIFPKDKERHLLHTVSDITFGSDHLQYLQADHKIQLLDDVDKPALINTQVIVGSELVEIPKC